MKSSKFLRNVLVIASATALSRIFGLIRDVVIANKFGAGAAYDAYIIAFFVPHLLRKLLAEGALSTAFIPIFTEYLTQKGKKAAQLFASNTLNLLLIFFPLLIGAGILFAPGFVPFLADGFSPAKINLTVTLTRIIFPFIGIIGVAALFMGILNSFKHFFAPAFAPVLFNLGVISGALFIGLYFERAVYGLAVGVIVGGIGQLLIQTPFLRGKFKYRWVWDPNHQGIKKLARMMLPVVIALAVTQINIMVDNKLASRLGDGSIAILQYGIRLFQLPLGVFAVAVATAILPRLSEQAASVEGGDIVPTLRSGIKLCIFIILPSVAGLYALGKPIIELIFEHGNFLHRDTIKTVYVLNNYLIGMIGYGLVYILTRAFYALKDTKMPVIAGIGAVVVNVTLDFLLIGPMKEGGLALATSIAGLFNMILLFILLAWKLRLTHRAGEIFPPTNQIAKMLIGAILTGFLTYLFYRIINILTQSEILLVAIPVLFGLLIYITISKIGGFLSIIYEIAD